MPSASFSTDWNRLSDAQQLHVTRAALHHAIHHIAGQAELLAGEMEEGSLLDRGGADALRLLAAALRISSDEQVIPPVNPAARFNLDALDPVGHA